MEFRRIGSLEVSSVGLGCNNFGRAVDKDQSIEIVSAALDGGINHFDTADMYNHGSSEEFLGNGLKGRRDKAIITTKFGQVWTADGSIAVDASPGHVREAIDESLRRLGTDYIDNYLLHIVDPATPIVDTLEAMTELVDAGKVREIGCSQVDLAFLRDAQGAAKENHLRPFVNVQNHYNLLERERDDKQLGVKEECVREGMAFVPYFPLASGILSGKYRRGGELPEGTRVSTRPIGGYNEEYVSSERVMDIVENLTEFAEARGHTLLELAFAGLLARAEFASIIAGATSPAQVFQNAKSADWKLSPDEFVLVKKMTGAPD